MTYVIPTVALAVIITSYLASRAARLSIVVGAVIAPVLGVWCIAPELIRAHHLFPRTVAHWTLVLTYLLFVFALIGLVVSAATGWLLGVVSAGRRRHFARPTFAAAAWSALTLPVSYALTGFAPYWALHPGVPSTSRLAMVAFMLATSIPVALASVLLLHRFDRARGLRIRHLVSMAGVLFGAGAAVLPLRVERPPSVPHVADSAQFKTNPARAPLLVLGVDGATWRVIQPVIDRGGAPTLARLSAAGVRGRVDAQWPPQYWSAPAWSAILTGHDRATTGVHEDLSVQAAGLPLFQLPLGFEPLLNAPLFVEAVLMYYDVIEPMPTPRAQLAVPPIWERLALGGDRVAVVGMPFTYPATGPATWVVSDRVGIDLWRLMSVAPGERNRATYPAGETNRLMAWFEPNAAAQAPILATLFPQLDWPMPGDTFVHPIDVLRQVVRDTEGMFGAGEWIVRADPAVNLLMVYVGSFDNVAHAFWQYRFPDEFPDAPPDPGDVAVLGPVMDRYVEYLDQHVGRLIASFPRPPNVLLVSDHGEARTADRFGWKGVHARDGLFLAAGPDVLTRPEWIDVSYYDVAPTMVTLRGARPPADLTGRVLVGEPAPVR